MRKSHEPATPARRGEGSMTGVSDPFPTRRTAMPRITTIWRSITGAVALSVLVALAPSPASAKTEIQFWHAMTGQLGDATNELVKQFNESQSEYEVKPLRKGTYPETLTAAIGAYRQRQAPNIVQVFEVGTQTMMLSGAIHPVYQLFKEQEIAMDWKDFIAPVVGYYSTRSSASSTSASLPPGRRTTSTPTAGGRARPIRSSSTASAPCTSSPRR